ncbi:MAG: putative selenate reductase subunit YgfK [Synergistaceae bacterium]|jgi:putative selenate reductase|nr:putative selenate reductase subunit YgfK [Synergistaceae bacterium]
MSHIMRPQSFASLLRWIEHEHREKESIFGIHRSLFWQPKKTGFFSPDLFGGVAATPIGPAAGPHTQLTRNIISAWLGGARYIELKTVQIMDEPEIGRPCIDAGDEGYNVEWSQELKLEQSLREYVKAWVLIPVLERMLGWDKTLPGGVVFNMSVGYNLEGILQPRMQTFMAKMLDASEEIAEYRDVLRKEFPRYADVQLPSALTNSVTLSTMHGCPPDEIGRIARHLLEDRGFNLFVKMNPTLLGRDEVRGILNGTLGWTEVHIPDPVFDHDLKYPQAVEIIKTMREASKKRGRFFGVKLSNTLATRNRRRVLPGEEMYMSGRALHPIAMNLWNRLSKEFGGDLNVSFSAGADALNAAGIFSCGALTVTMATDLLKPGGYSRIVQCLENLEAAMSERGAKNLSEFAADRAANLEKVAADSLVEKRYKKNFYPAAPKVESELALFDCVEAPCVAKCAVCQDVPAYAFQIAKGDYDGALRTILRKNPLPGLTGHVCTHLCETRCARADYDEPVGIRALKRFAASRGKVSYPRDSHPKILSPEAQGKEYRVAVIGAGPSGLAAAATLALAGVGVTVYEARGRAGGMMAIAPHFRLPPEVLDEDVKRITDLGVRIELNHAIGEPPENLLDRGFDAVYVATGFPNDLPLDIPGIDAKGVWTALKLLEATTIGGERPDLGKKALVIGGGNTAMVAARTARRLTGNPVTVVYRRTRKEMPAIGEERSLLFEEGNLLEELALPVAVVVRDGRAAGLECERAKPGEPDAGGRRVPVPTGEKFTIGADSIVVAVGQSAETAIFGPEPGGSESGRIELKKNGAVSVGSSGRTNRSGVYAGGDATSGPDTVIRACADGMRAAEAICESFGIRVRSDVYPERGPRLTDEDVLIAKRARARKTAPNREGLLPVAERGGFDPAERTLGEEEARAEARRCLQCATFCDKCVEVCPNRANYACTVRGVAANVPIVALSRKTGFPEVVATEPFVLSQSRQILHVDDFCNACGNCATFCVHEGKPYMDKPRICLNEEDFTTQDDNVWRVSEGLIRRRENGAEACLKMEESGGYAYEDDALRVSFDPGFAVRRMTVKKTFDGERSLRSAVEMSVVYDGIKNSMPWLLRAQ